LGSKWLTKVHILQLGIYYCSNPFIGPAIW
jgi:hypothetical protein